MFDIVSDFVLVASFFRGVKRRKQLERPWKDVWVGGGGVVGNRYCYGSLGSCAINASEICQGCVLEGLLIFFR